MSISECKQQVLSGNGGSVMDRFFEETTPMLERHIWSAYKAGDSAELGNIISAYMDTLVFQVAADMGDIEATAARRAL